MMVRTVNDLPAATHGETVRCLIAIELSKRSWVVAFNTPLSEKISRRTLTGCKWKKLLELIEDVRVRVSRQMGRSVEVMSCYEAGYDGFWLHRQLEAHGVRNYVIDPASLQVDRRPRRVKTDRMDTERLLRSLMAYLRGEPKVWSVVRVPSVAEEDARRLHRECDWCRKPGNCRLGRLPAHVGRDHVSVGPRLQDRDGGEPHSNSRVS